MASMNVNFDVNAWFAQAQDQLRWLNTNEPGQWPLLPKLAAFALTAVDFIA